MNQSEEISEKQALFLTSNGAKLGIHDVLYIYNLLFLLMVVQLPRDVQIARACRI